MRGEFETKVTETQWKYYDPPSMGILKIRDESKSVNRKLPRSKSAQHP